MLNAIAAVLAAMWSLGCVGGPLWMAVTSIREGDRAIGLACLTIGFPVGSLLACLPWAFMTQANSPDLVTLKKNEWACVASHTQTTMVASSTGKITTMIPVTTTICDAYGRTT